MKSTTLLSWEDKVAIDFRMRGTEPFIYKGHEEFSIVILDLDTNCEVEKCLHIHCIILLAGVLHDLYALMSS